MERLQGQLGSQSTNRVKAGGGVLRPHSPHSYFRQASMQHASVQHAAAPAPTLSLYILHDLVLLPLMTETSRTCRYQT